MTDNLDKVAATTQSRATAVRVRNVLNPLLWLSAVTLSTCLPGAYLLRDYPWFAGPILAGALVCMASTLAAFFLFAFRDPQRLQSEEYLIEQQRLILERKGASPVGIDGVQIGLNPELPRLPPAGEYEQR